MLLSSARILRFLCATIMAALLLTLGACGGGGPDTADAKAKLLEHVNYVAEGHARFTEFDETGRKMEGEGDFQGCTVSFAGELEFTGDCEYNMEMHKQGDRMPFEAQVEYLKGESGWEQASMGLYPL